MESLNQVVGLSLPHWDERIPAPRRPANAFSRKPSVIALPHWRRGAKANGLKLTAVDGKR